MGIEKIASSGAMPYQGSAAVATQEAASVTQSVGASAQTMKQPTQDFSLDMKNGEATEATEEMGAAQSAQLKSAVSDLNKQMKNSEAIFGIHDKTNRVTIKIVDKTTREVIKEYPPEQTLDMIAKVWEIAGILVDEKR